MMTDEQVRHKYGEPGDLKNLVTIMLPFPLRIAWDPKTTTRKLTCHKLIKDQLLAVFDDILLHYGQDKIKELGIDLFGGCYNFRKMRGGSKWSRHSWAIAVDLDPARNGLKTKWKDAQFSKPEYKAMVDAFYKHGFFSYGKERDFDAMHFEINS